jgi:hypothetical protein
VVVAPEAAPATAGPRKPVSRAQGGTSGGPDPGRVMVASLLGWGIGYLRMGERRGWLLLGAEVLWATAIGVSLALLPTDRWLLVYGLLTGFIIAWVGQGITAYRRARALSGQSSGAAWLLVLAPVVIVLLTGFWLVGGATASPAATFQRYVDAWEGGHPDDATALFSAAPGRQDLADEWQAQHAWISGRVGALAAASPEWSLDEENPEANLRFTQSSAAATGSGTDQARFDIQIVRQVTVPTTFLGLLPATQTETRVVETIGSASLVRTPLDGPLSFLQPSVWLIESVTIGGQADP